MYFGKEYFCFLCSSIILTIVGGKVLDKVPNRNGVKTFPEGFKFGTATASYQIEGGWDAADKGPSIWDYTARNQSYLIYQEENGDVACDSYNQYERDVEMLRELGVDFYRFSINWPRILPTGYANQVSQAGLDYYNNLINELLKYGIEPVISIYHWELPQKLQELGGWTNELIVDWYTDFANILFENYADRVKMWITFNEPASVCFLGYEEMSLAPFVDGHASGNYFCARNLVLAHAKTFHLYQSRFKEMYDGQIGVAFHMRANLPASDLPEDIAAAEDLSQFYEGLYAHPIYGAEGDFPATVKERVAKKSAEQGYPRSRLPELSPEEIEYIKGTYDFYGINHYTSILVSRDESYSNKAKTYEDAGVVLSHDPSWGDTGSAWFKVNVKGLRHVMRRVRDEYGNPKTWIFENGLSTSPDVGVDDDDRVDYMRENIAAVSDAIVEDGVNMVGYTHWSLMDNFEWTAGYNERFGIYHVDFEDPARPRTPKKSAAAYRDICRNRVLNYDYIPDTADVMIN